MKKIIFGSRREWIKRMAAYSALLPFPGITAYASDSRKNAAIDFSGMKKIDVHMHISSDADYLREVMDELNLKMNIMTNKGIQADRLTFQRNSATAICKQYPRYYSWCTTFGFEEMFKADWTERTIQNLKTDFDNGAVAVKVWKEIGMEVKKADGQFILIDDPIFRPIFKYTEEQGKTLFTHIGDPVDNWLSVGADGKHNFWYKEGGDITVNRIGKFQGEVSWDKLMIARDKVIAEYPEMKIIGCHLLSMPHDVDLVARRLDKFSNLAVDTSLTLPYLMGQAREKVRAFFIKYQDKILYGLDESGGVIPTQYLKDMTKVGLQWTMEELKKEKTNLLRRYNNDFDYYASEKAFKLKNYSAKGLALPEELLEKIFYRNALRWIPGIEKGF